MNSGTRVMACRERVKWFYQKQSTAVQWIDCDSFKSPDQSETLYGRGDIPAKVVHSINSMFFLQKARNAQPTFFIFNLKAMRPPTHNFPPFPSTGRLFVGLFLSACFKYQFLTACGISSRAVVQLSPQTSEIAVFQS